MNIFELQVGILPTNCYIVATDQNNCVVIDPGDDGKKIYEFIKNKKLTVKSILLTHGHFDHICAVEYLRQKTGAVVYIHKEDAVMLSDSCLSLANTIGKNIHTNVNEFSTVVENDVINVDNLSFKVMHTPGHTRGSVSYIVENYIFSGDTLFYCEVGRTDLPTGSYNEIIKSVKRLAELPGDYKVYPGHDRATTLQFERENNRYIKG